MNSPLTGKALIKKLKELERLSKEEKARACGYVKITKSGRDRVNLLGFLRAVLEAEDIQLDPAALSKRGGREAGFRITVQGNGGLLIGSAYTKQLGLQPGDEFEIKLGRRDIKLIRVGAEEEEEVAA